MGVKLDSNTFIGPFVEIQKDVVIGEQCKIQSFSFICELVTIGNNCFIGHGVMFVNDLFSTGGPARAIKICGKALPLVTMFLLEAMPLFYRLTFVIM